MLDGVGRGLRRPEYTGENRCLPCTAVNVVLAALGSGAVAAVGARAGRPTVGLAAGGVAFALSLAAIYLRGYLVPGTPRLTKRYLPPRVLALFGKGPAAGPAGGAVDGVADDAADGAADDPRDEVDPEAVLLEVGAVEECADADDLCLTGAFRAAWNRRIDAVDPTDRDPLFDLLGIDADADAETEEHGEAFRLWVDGQFAGQWESQAAYVADVAAAGLLAERHDGWSALSSRARGEVLSGLRLFVEICPACGGVPEFGAETVESCCSRHEVAAVTCRDCGARLFESEPLA